MEAELQEFVAGRLAAGLGRNPRTTAPALERPLPAAQDEGQPAKSPQTQRDHGEQRVQTVLDEIGPGCFSAFLGDDVTDAHAFRALNVP